MTDQDEREEEYELGLPNEEEWLRVLQRRQRPSELPVVTPQGAERINRVRDVGKGVK